jgi:hypothetical protein
MMPIHRDATPLADAVVWLRARALLTRPLTIPPLYELTPQQFPLSLSMDEFQEE